MCKTNFVKCTNYIDQLEEICEVGLSTLSFDLTHYWLPCHFHQI